LIPADKKEKYHLREFADNILRQAAMTNSMENVGYQFPSVLKNIFIDQIEQNEEMTARFMNEKEFQTIVGRHLLERFYDQIRTEERNPA